MSTGLLASTQMKPILQQFVDALGYKGKSLVYYWDFTLTVVAGIAVLFGEMFGMEAHSGRSAFDLRVAVGCFALVVMCVLVAVNRLFVVGGAVMVPAALVGWHFCCDWRSQDRRVLSGAHGRRIRSAGAGSISQIALAAATRYPDQMIASARLRAARPRCRSQSGRRRWQAGLREIRRLQSGKFR